MPSPLTLSEIVSSPSSTESSCGAMVIPAAAPPIPLGSARRFSSVSGGAIVAMDLGIVNGALADALKPTTFALPLPLALITTSSPVNALV